MREICHRRGKRHIGRISEGNETGQCIDLKEKGWNKKWKTLRLMDDWSCFHEHFFLLSIFHIQNCRHQDEILENKEENLLSSPRTRNLIHENPESGDGIQERIKIRSDKPDVLIRWYCYSGTKSPISHVLVLSGAIFQKGLTDLRLPNLRETQKMILNSHSIHMLCAWDGSASCQINEDKRRAKLHHTRSWNIYRGSNKVCYDWSISLLVTYAAVCIQRTGNRRYLVWSHKDCEIKDSF